MECASIMKIVDVVTYRPSSKSAELNNFFLQHERRAFSIVHVLFSLSIYAQERDTSCIKKGKTSS